MDIPTTSPSRYGRTDIQTGTRIDMISDKCELEQKILKIDTTNDHVLFGFHNDKRFRKEMHSIH